MATEIEKIPVDFSINDITNQNTIDSLLSLAKHAEISLIIRAKHISSKAPHREFLQRVAMPSITSLSIEDAIEITDEDIKLFCGLKSLELRDANNFFGTDLPDFITRLKLWWCPNFAASHVKRPIKIEIHNENNFKPPQK